MLLGCYRVVKVLEFVIRFLCEFRPVAPFKSLYCALDCLILEYEMVYYYSFYLYQKNFYSFIIFTKNIQYPPYDYILQLSFSLIINKTPTCNTNFHIPTLIPFSTNNYDSNSIVHIIQYAKEKSSFSLLINK